MLGVPSILRGVHDAVPRRDAAVDGVPVGDLSRLTIRVHNWNHEHVLAIREHAINCDVLRILDELRLCAGVNAARSSIFNPSFRLRKRLIGHALLLVLVRLRAGAHALQDG